MSEFKNVEIIKKANVYFDGKVTSRSIRFEDGKTKTLGYMLPGEYEFNTEAPELMEVLGGNCEVQLSGESGWNTYSEHAAFDVPGNSKFKIKTATGLDYCCSFKA